jgi:hypothetical protein
MELTEKELAVIKAFAATEYGSGMGDEAIWTFSIEDHSGLSGKVFSGTVSSLTKKGLVRSDTTGDRTMGCRAIEDTYSMWLTEEGQKIFNKIIVG